MKNVEYVRIEDENYKEGNRHVFKTGKECVILGVYRKYVDGKSQDIFIKVKMSLTGYETFIPRRLMDTATGYDPYEPRIAGIGFIGEGEYRARKSPKNGGGKYKSYACWENMMWRVYDDKHRLANRYIGRGVTVCEEWHNFQNFAPWFLENYPDKLGYALDSDIFRGDGPKIYSPETCVFIPQDINKFFGAMNENRGEYPVGVRIRKDKYYDVHMTHNNESILKCGFADPDSAFLWYKKHKEDALRKLAEYHFLMGNIDDLTYHALLDWRAVPYPE